MRRLSGTAVLLCMLGGQAVAAPGTYESCSSAVDPPTCLVELAAPDEDSDEHFLDGVIVAGATGVIERHASRLALAVKRQAATSNAFAEAIGLKLPADPAVAEAGGAQSAVALAAVALAAATHTHDDPFGEAVAKKLISAAGNHPAIAQIAVILWREADTYSEWNGGNPNTRPRGMSAVWRAVIERPPTHSHVLASIANSASARGYRVEGLALLRIAMARKDLSNKTRANVASQFARWHRMPDEAQQLMDDGGAKAEGYSFDGINLSIARARLYRGYDEKAAGIVRDDCLKGLSQDALYSYIGEENLVALGAGKALRELLLLGDAYLVRAREPNKNPEDQGQWFALASEAFRLGGDRAKAVAAAHEGVPFVAPAVGFRNAPLGKPITDKRQAAVNANGFGTAPVVALYRAGAHDEAVRTGFLSGYDRYMNAEIAGEPADSRWVLEDNSSFYNDIVERHLIWRDDIKGALHFYDGLRCSSTYDAAVQSELNSLLGTLAALIGRRSSMAGHFAVIASRLDREGNGATATTRAYFAIVRAADWRRGLIIAERKGASPDVFTNPSCARER